VGGVHEIGDRHFAGVTTHYLLAYLRSRLSPEAVEDVLSRAGEHRSVEELTDDTSWSSYAQMRRLLEEGARAVGGAPALRHVGTAPLVTMPDFTSVLQSLGSPASLFGELSELARHFSPILSMSTREVSSTEWICELRFEEGFEPFTEYCDFTCGMLGVVPHVFGLGFGEAREEACMTQGAPACSFRIRWDDRDLQRIAEHYQLRTEVLEARLEGLQAVVADLVSGDELEVVLQRIVASAARAVSAPAYVLALEALPAAAKRVYAHGLADANAAPIADVLLNANGDDEATRITVDVASPRRGYGRLAAIHRRGGRFLPQEKSILQAYARLAAAALDSATALEESRRQEMTARSLLALSISLSELMTVDEVAARCVRAVPAVVDCDRAAVFLVDEVTGNARVVAHMGYPPEAESRLRAVSTPVRNPADDAVASAGLPQSSATVRDLASAVGSVGAIVVPIVSNAERIGWLSASVTEDADRLENDPEALERLRGLAALAGTAVRNAGLVEQIRHQALHDALTGLPNRALVLDRVEQMVSRARRRFGVPSVLFIDLDGFKEINDTLGHTAGDQLLRAVAARLEAVLRHSETIGRLGGDEFVVLTEGDTNGPAPELVAERLLDVLREPFEIAGLSVKVTASIGIAVGDRSAPGELLRDADIALYRAKASGKNRHVVFAPEMHAAVLDHRQLELDLRAALALDEFFLVYQPICSLETRAVTGVEALLRWRHPTRGVVQPALFIPMLEETGMIVDVGRWVLHTACAQAAAWHRSGHPLDLSVNVSAKQLDHDDFIADVHGALEATGLHPSALVLEITESVAMRDADATAVRLSRFKDLGVRVAIDDFGTGYSSLAHLRRFPVDSLKIDRSFIAGIRESPETEALVHMLVQLGKTLAIETVAEGIEDYDQYSHLRREHCDSGQGFLIARPLEVSDVEGFLRAPEAWAGERTPEERAG
jgi:diguanylate cyclase (GGDEF)-like protein